jgi:hypothetical protein
VRSTKDVPEGIKSRSVDGRLIKFSLKLAKIDSNSEPRLSQDELFQSWDFALASVPMMTKGDEAASKMGVTAAEKSGMEGRRWIEDIRIGPEFADSSTQAAKLAKCMLRNLPDFAIESRIKMADPYA